MPETFGPSLHSMGRKGGICLAQIGYLRIKATASRARLPVEDTAVAVLSDDGKLLALQLTDSSGNTAPIRIEVPNAENSQSPDPGKPVFRAVSIYARAEGFAQILVRNVQVFADTTTVQELRLVPLSELPGTWNDREVFDTPPQNL